MEELAYRAALNRKDLATLAGADALRGLAGHRRNARWTTTGIRRAGDFLDGVSTKDQLPALPVPTEGEEIVADYGAMSLTLGRHPLALLRDRLRGERLLTAEELRAIPHGRRARAAGLVTCRQRPSTASGVVFVTLEDETGCVNVIVWRDLVERQRAELLGATLLGVAGQVERDGDVVHLVAQRLTDHSALLGTLQTQSRDFH